MTMAMMVEEEFLKLVGLVKLFEELDHGQSEQARLLQALRKLRRRSSRNHRALSSLSPHPADRLDRSKLIRNDIRWRLRKEELPVLYAQLAQLFSFLDPSNLPEQPNTQLREALKTLSEMEDSVDRIKSATDSVWEDTIVSVENIEELTVNRSLQLVAHCKSALIELSRTIESFERFFHVLVISPLDGKIYDSDQPLDYLQEFRKESIPRSIQRELKSIQILINWLAQSNLVVLQQDWRSMVDTIDDTVNDLVDFGNLSAIKDDPNKLIIYNQIHALIPIAKLSRLLLNKLSKPTNSEPRLISTISLENLERLRCTTGSMSTDLNDILNTFDTPRPHDITLTRAINTLVHSSRTINSILHHHFLDYPDQDSIRISRTWSQLWYSEFDIAVISFLWVSEKHVHDDIDNDPDLISI
ncbi:hypothetical protein PSTG_05156 [Puccinia striiformis f. sp. tritici PST-78]|uniref:Uncharacterized protein n=1 Tax=Puccinia striiformis f. sp. tritici PST-78 TaxID=1165861 RepID=A0A0L0VR28_9BASI|nr:hypothetical protein PSTG_05156 [Puccinia striiformis f. sp. tritici PST-78]